MGNITTANIGGTSYDIADAQARQAVDTLASAVDILQADVTELKTTVLSEYEATLKAILDGTYE